VTPVPPEPSEPGQIDVEITQNDLDLDIDADPDIGRAPLTVHFSAVLANEPPGTLSYEWDFGDGAHATGNPTTHTYTAAGEYTATLTVADSTGQRGDSDVEIQVDARGSSGAD
jgi:cytochrome c